MKFSPSLFLLSVLTCVVWCSATYGTGGNEDVEAYLAEQPRHLSSAGETHTENVNVERNHVVAESAVDPNNGKINNNHVNNDVDKKGSEHVMGNAESPESAQSTGRKLLSVAEGSVKKNIEEDGLFGGLSWLSLFATGFLLILCGALFVFEVVLPPRARKGKTLPPVYSEGLPYIGTIAAFAKSPLQLLERGHAATSGYFTVRVAHKRLTFLTNPEAVEAFFKADDDTLDSAKVYRLTVPVFGEGVIYDAPLDKRAQQIKMLAACLRTAKLQSYVPLLESEVLQYSSRWGNSGEIDVATVMSELIILTASRCLLGPDVRENVFESVARLFSELDQGMQPISVLAPYLPTKAHAIRDRAHKEMCSLFSRIIARRRAADGETQKKQQQADDILESLMAASYRDGTPLTDKEISGMLIALLFAGQHTSSVTASWTGLFLTRHPEMMQRVMAEQEATGASKGNLDTEILGRLNTLHACVRESLRMYPPLIFLMRAVLKDMIIGDVVIPAGDIVFASPAHAGRLSEIFSNPDKWDPDRYLPPREEDKKTAIGNISFGMGRHHCLGENFGLLQVKTIWSTLLRNYTFEPVGPLPRPDYSGMVVGPIHSGCILRYTRRAAQQ